MHWFVLAVVTASYLILRRVTRSPFGMVLQSIRENEPRTRAIGYPVERYKIVSVMLSGLFAGLAGVLYAIQNQFAAPDFVYFLTSGDTVIYNVIGGIGTLVGPIVGAGFFQLMRELMARLFGDQFPYLIPLGIDLHRDDHLPAAGPARLCAAVAEPLQRRTPVSVAGGIFAQKLRERRHVLLVAVEILGDALVKMRGAFVELVRGRDPRRRSRRSRASRRPSDRPWAASAPSRA